MNAVNRRNFLKGSAAATLAVSAFGLKAMARPSAPHYRVALIGTGWYGTSDLLRLIQVADVEVVALCDVDSEQLSKAGKRVSERQKSKKVPKLYKEYKKLLAETKPDLVLVGTPDHWHPLIMIDAVKSGAHVYCQKPISVDVIEGEAMVAAARKYGKVVQVGTQRRSTPFLVQAKENIIEKGLLGKISHVEICCYYHMRNGSNPPEQAIPANLDYEMWTGPAPYRPYDGSPHIRWWRAFKEYGNGIMGDMCVHMLDAVRWCLDLDWPKKITSTGGIYVQKDAKSNISDTQVANFEFDEMNVVWTHRTWGAPSNDAYPWSYIFYGDKGTLRCSTQQYDFTPVGDGEKIHGEPIIDGKTYPEDMDEERIEIHAANANRAHLRNFVDAIENNTLPVADILQGHISTASCIIANISMELGGRPLVYDPKSMTIVGDHEATQLLNRPYRAPYVHPLPSNV
ncbi:Gfo/Idh/MocA family oxidoreductase [Marinilongibacter aquaticus]|uniref:Gfo/Idh/MocA family oxidoreductase n=1 Tax=Marinilongibacter aquaticus TaxID=2975157 RepID=UPI0021BD4967|nr:Gfo/Idh/MocA family oxidoreductase [Marinilongibacter aquaticus]UBM59018.1 Gfo/Idh/MocA family oxidoreductase [Marinilongibacter aquaticus]